MLPNTQSLFDFHVVFLRIISNIFHQVRTIKYYVNTRWIVRNIHNWVVFTETKLPQCWNVCGCLIADQTSYVNIHRNLFLLFKTYHFNLSVPCWCFMSFDSMQTMSWLPSFKVFLCLNFFSCRATKKRIFCGTVCGILLTCCKKAMHDFSMFCQPELSGTISKEMSVPWSLQRCNLRQSDMVTLLIRQ